MGIRTIVTALAGLDRYDFPRDGDQILLEQFHVSKRIAGKL